MGGDELALCENADEVKGRLGLERDDGCSRGMCIRKRGL